MHINRCHKHVFSLSTKEAVPRAESPLAGSPSHDSQDTTEGEVNSEPDVPGDEEDATATAPSDQCFEHLSSLLLKWQEGRQLPEKTINEIANDVIMFTTEHQRALCSADLSKLKQLRTKRGRENHWKTLHGFVSPRTVACSDRAWETFQYVPILETIRAVSQVRNLFEGEEKGNSVLLEDVKDGAYFRQHTVFMNADKKKLLALQLYFDEFEVCNPLGSKRGKHKVLAGYLTIFNGSPKCRSKLSDKCLVLLAKASLVKKFGLQEIMKPLLADLHELEVNGVALGEEIVKGSLLYLSGDNLSSHEFGAFRTCFSSGPICRFCLATRDDIQKKWNEKEFVLRTKDAHVRHVQLVATDSTLSSIYGVVGKSCLSEVDSFDVTQGLPPDIMHDIFEGVIPFVMKRVIRCLITDNVFKLAQLNERLATFPFQGGDKSSRLPPLTRKSVFGKAMLKGSASEKLCFFRFFSLLIGDYVPRDNKAYKVYLALRAVIDIVVAPQVYPDAVAYLKVLIEDFYRGFKKTFPLVKIIPKMHYLVHYPRLLLLHGPLVKLSCMRFEAKHQYFKSLAQKTRNFRNICATLSRRHQMHFMYSLAQPVQEMLFAGSKTVDQSSLPDILRDRLQDLNLADESVQAVASLTLSERKLELAGVVPLVVREDDLPRFAQIQLMAICDSKLFIVASILNTKCFNEHFHSFVVEHTKHSVIIEDVSHHAEFFDLLYLYKRTSSLYVSPRYTFFTDPELSCL